MSSLSGSIRILPEVLRSRSFATITGTYATLGTSLDNACRMLEIVNDTDDLLTFSINGTQDFFVIPPLTARIWDFSSNKTDISGSAYMARGTQFYVKGTPTIGSVYLTSWYGFGS